MSTDCSYDKQGLNALLKGLTNLLTKNKIPQKHFWCLRLIYWGCQYNISPATLWPRACGETSKYFDHLNDF